MLGQVQNSMTVDAIMTQREGLLMLNRSEESTVVQEDVRNLQINQVPVIDDGSVVGILVARDHERRTLPDTEEFEPISPEWLVSVDTSIRRLIDILDDRQHPARFVIQENRVAGLVTYADLNKAVARTALYLLISRLEIKLARLIRHGAKDIWTYIESLDEDRRDELVGLQDEMTENDVAHDLVEHFKLGDVIGIVRDEPSLLDQTEVSSRDHFNGLVGGIENMRHDVAHSVKLVVEDVGSVGDVNHVCQSIEKLLKRIPSHPPGRRP